MDDAREDSDLRGLTFFGLRSCDLLVPHAAGVTANANVRRYPGFSNLGNTCFLNTTLQVFLNVEALRVLVRNPLCPPVVHVADADASSAKLRRVREALKEVEERYASNNWSAIVPIRVLKSVFSVGTPRYAMIAGRQCDAMDCFYIFCSSLGLSAGPQCWVPTPEQMLQ